MGVTAMSLLILSVSSSSPLCPGTSFHLSFLCSYFSLLQLACLLLPPFFNSNFVLFPTFLLLPNTWPLPGSVFVLASAHATSVALVSPRLSSHFISLSACLNLAQGLEKHSTALVEKGRNKYSNSSSSSSSSSHLRNQTQITVWLFCLIKWLK